MHSFIRLCMILVILLCVTITLGLDQKTPSRKLTPQLLNNYKSSLGRDFQKTEPLNVLFSFLTGDKAGISPKTIKAFKNTNLSYLLSFGGLHLRALLFIAFSVVSFCKTRRLKHHLKLLLSLALICYQGSPVLSRLGILRFVNLMKFKFSLKIKTESLFYFCFLISFLFGHFHTSPIGYLFSMGFIGLFIFTQYESMGKRILCIYLLMSLFSFFLGFRISLYSIIIGLVGTYIFSYFFIFILIFLFTYPILKINWIESPLIFFIDTLKLLSKYAGLTHLASIPFILALIALIFFTDKKIKISFILFGFLFHSDIARAPSFFISPLMQTKKYNLHPPKKQLKSHFILNVKKD